MDETIYVILKALFDFALEVWFSICWILVLIALMMLVYTRGVEIAKFYTCPGTSK